MKPHLREESSPSKTQPTLSHYTVYVYSQANPTAFHRIYSPLNLQKIAVLLQHEQQPVSQETDDGLDCDTVPCAVLNLRLVASDAFSEIRPFIYKKKSFKLLRASDTPNVGEIPLSAPHSEAANGC